jgi:abequosyltransferase
MSAYLSICIPTKGRLAILKDTLDSIFADKSLNYDDFEVVLSDNSDNYLLEDLLAQYKEYPNIVYGKTNVEGFFNSINALKLGRGIFLKLHNDYTRFDNRALQRMIEFVKAETQEKPLIYFSNTELKKRDILRYKSFNDFCYALSFLGTWSTGFAIWKEDFDKCDKDHLNKIFPHTTLLFEQYYKGAFIINDEKLFSNEIVYTKGGYNLFHAFAVQYLNMTEESFKTGNITRKTFRHIKYDLFRNFLIAWYYNTKVAKNQYTYDLSDIKKSGTTYYNYFEYYLMIVLAYIKYVLKRIISKN